MGNSRRMILILVLIFSLMASSTFAKNKSFILKKGSLVSRTEEALRRVDKLKEEEDFVAINTLRNAGIIAFSLEDVVVYVQEYKSGRIVKIRPEGSVQIFWTHDWMIE